MRDSSNGSLQEPVGIAVVGLGDRGPNLVRNLNELPRRRRRSRSATSSEDALAKIGLRYPAVETTTRFDDVLADDRVDAVAIAHPRHDATHPLAAAALKAGKHVFVEKPLAASSEEARDLIALADSNGLVLMPGHTFLYSPPVIADPRR